MYKRGEVKMLLFSDGQHHQAQVFRVKGLVRVQGSGFRV
jgi:hypothetical protein